MSDTQTTGLLFAGDLLVSIKNPTTGVFGGYQRLQCDKLEVKAPSDQLQKISKGRETFGQSFLTYNVPKPAEVSIVLDEVSRGVMSMLLSGELTEFSQPAGALAAIDVTVSPGEWMEIGHEYLDLANIEVTNAAGTATYDNGVDYEINPRLGMIYVPVGGVIAAGTVKLTAQKKAFDGAQILGGKQASTVMKFKLDGINLIDRRNMLLVGPQTTVSAKDAFDFLSGKLASVPLNGIMEIAPGYTSAFQLKYFD